MIRLLKAILLVTSFSVVADTEVPHTFEDGTPAKASEANANFDALEAAIDALGLPNDCNVGDYLVFTPSGWECQQPVALYSVGGNISGMQTPKNSATLSLNGVGMSLFGNGAFTFPNAIASGASYTVLVEAPAPTTSYDERCVVENGDGTVSADVTDVSVSCFPYARLKTDTFSDANSTTVSQHFDSYSPNVSDRSYCDAQCDFILSNVADHSNCSLTAFDFYGNDYQPNVTVAADYIVVNNSNTLFGSGSVIVEIVCPDQ